MHQRITVAGDKAVALGIKALAELAGARERLIDKAFGMEPPILPLGGNGWSLGMQRAGDIRVGEATGDVHPAVRTKRWAGHAQLLAAAFGAEPGKHDTSYIGVTIAGGILQKPDVWCAGDKHAAFPRQDTVWESKPIGKGRALLEEPVAVGILQQSDSPKLGHFLAFGRQEGITEALHHVHASPFIKAHRHGIADLRLSGGQLDVHAFLHLKRPKCLRGRKCAGIGI